MRIAYGKLGRSIPLSLEDASNVGGDIEVVRLLQRLLDDDNEVHLVGRNRGLAGDLAHTGPNGKGVVIDQWGKHGVFANMPESAREMGPKFEAYRDAIGEAAKKLPKFDLWIIWLGQHGSSVHPVPVVQAGRTGYTNPMGSDVNYGFPLVHMVNVLDVKPIWLCPDPRNMVKFRDLWDPKQRTIFAQFNTSKDNTFYDERDGKLRTGSTSYAYAGIELLAVPPLEPGDRPPLVPPSRLFGLLVNEGYNNLGTKGRLSQIQKWVPNIAEYEIFGTWSEPSMKTLNRVITPVPLRDVTNTLRRWRATMTFPATASGWATAKPWECFKAGVVCFKHPDYDTQRHIYGQHMPEELRTFLCPATSNGFKNRLHELEDDATWQHMVRLQYEYFVTSHLRLDGGFAYFGPHVSPAAFNHGEW